MKASSVIPFLLLTFSLLTVSYTQEDSRRLMGLGVSIDPARIGHVEYVHFLDTGVETGFFTNVSPVLFYVPIDVTSSFRLEPSLGFYSASSDTRTTTTAQFTDYPRTTISDASIITLGIRGAFLSPLSNSLSLYVGPRFDFSFVSSSYEHSYMSGFPTPNTLQTYKTTSKETDATIGLILGAEYYPVSHFSIGGEISLNYLTFGNPEVTNEQTPPPSPPLTTYTTDRKQHMFRTDALFFLRWFFVDGAL